MRHKTTQRAKSRRLAVMAQALIARAVSPAEKDRRDDNRRGGSGARNRRLLTACLVESRRANRLRLSQELRNDHG
jgi:hypothetical protein